MGKFETWHWCFFRPGYFPRYYFLYLDLVSDVLFRFFVEFLITVLTFEEDIHDLIRGEGSVKIKISCKCIRIFLAVPYGTTRKIIYTALLDSKIFMNYEYITVSYSKFDADISENPNEKYHKQHNNLVFRCCHYEAVMTQSLYDFTTLPLSCVSTNQAETL